MSLEAAKALVDGERQESYGEPIAHMQNVARCWSGILGYTVSPLQVALCMAGLKLVREGNRHDPDNALDALGYVIIAQRIADAGHYDRTDSR